MVAQATSPESVRSFCFNNLGLALPLPLLSRCEVEPPPLLQHKEGEMSAARVALDPFVQNMEGAVVELRREAVNAVIQQQRLREEMSAIRTRASEIEQQASQALARGEDLLARQILARGIFTLKTRDALEAELAEARGHVAQLLTTMVRTENRAWSERRPHRG
jgi:phage shock protein A